MIRLITKSFLRQLKQRTGIIVLLLFGLVVSFFCISTSQGIGLKNYYYISGRTNYGTVTIVPSDDSFDINSFTEWVNAEHNKNNVVNTLYLHQAEDMLVRIGWQGTEWTRWFAASSGRFFTADEANSNLIVVYDSGKNVSEDTTVLVEDREMEIVGTGTLIPYYFRLGISAASGSAMMTSDETEIQILPYGTFLQLYTPEMILVQFQNLSRSQIESKMSAISARFPNAQVYPPNVNSDAVKTEEQIAKALESFILCIISGVTIVQLVSLWTQMLKSEISVYAICGLEKRKCILFVYILWAFLFIIASALAVFIHWLLLPLLGKFDADLLPMPVTYSLLVLIVFLATAFYSYETVARSATATKGRSSR